MRKFFYIFSYSVYNNEKYVFNFREFKSTSLKSLRVGVNSFFDYVILIIETIDQFGPPRSNTYSHYTYNA